MMRWLANDMVWSNTLSKQSGFCIWKACRVNQCVCMWVVACLTTQAPIRNEAQKKYWEVWRAVGSKKRHPQKAAHPILMGCLSVTSDAQISRIYLRWISELDKIWNRVWFYGRMRFPRRNRRDDNIGRRRQGMGGLCHCVSDAPLWPQPSEVMITFICVYLLPTVDAHGPTIYLVLLFVSKYFFRNPNKSDTDAWLKQTFESGKITTFWKKGSLGMIMTTWVGWRITREKHSAGSGHKKKP